MSARKLTERHVRWSQVLSEFNFQLNYRAGKKGERPDALSRREQDVPQFSDDHGLKEREFQLINKNLWVHNNKEKPVLIPPIDENKIPKGKNLFEDGELRTLWNKGVEKDTSFKKLYSSILKNERTFPTELGLKTSLSECTIDDKGALFF